jgi:hypothetical protein
MTTPRSTTGAFDEVWHGGTISTQQWGSSGGRTDPSTRDLVAFPVFVFFLTHLGLLVLTALAPNTLSSPNIAGNASALPHGDILRQLGDWSAPWFRFDARWYVSVVQHGYHFGAADVANTNFMPVYPALIWVVRPLTGGSPWLAAWLVANAACVAAFVALYRWALLRWTPAVAKRIVILFAAFPFSFFLMAPYAEPVFLLLAVAAFLFAEMDRPVLAVLAASFATITRPVGLALVVGLAAFYLQRRRPRLAASSLLALIPLIAYIGYVWTSFGHVGAVVIPHSPGWVAAHGSVLDTLRSQFSTPLQPMDRVDAATAVLFLASGIAVWHKFGWGYGVYVILGVLLPLAHGLVSMERYVVVLFPAMALWGSWENRLGQALLFCVSLFGLVIFAVLFTRGYSVF